MSTVSRIEVLCLMLALGGSGTAAWVGIKEDIATLTANDEHLQKDSILFAQAVGALDSTLGDVSVTLGKMGTSLHGLEKGIDHLKEEVKDLRDDVAEGR